jgi:RNA polymerase sigma-70 factor (ECF subfamily)
VTADPSTPDPDTALVARIRAGDQRAFREIWDCYHVALADFAYRYARRKDLAMDIVQHVFFTVWQNRVTLAPRTTLANYLYAATRNRAWNLVKHERIVHAYEQRLADLYANEPAVTRNAGEAALASDELGEQIRAIVNGLTPRVREIYLMSREDGLSPTQIAEVLGISAPVVYNQLSKALRALSQGLDLTN